MLLDMMRRPEKLLRQPIELESPNFTLSRRSRARLPNGN